jgi:beta-glucanase (GH16 family)
VVLLLCMAATLPGRAEPPGQAQPLGSSGGRWVLAFEDEFEGFALDTSKWSNGYGWGNSSGSTQAYCDPANNIVVDGILVQQARNLPQEGKPYSGACLNTMNKFSQLYGYWEARMRTPPGRGFYTAWAKPNSGGWPPELDVAEIPGGFSNRVTTTVHWQDGLLHRKTNNRYYGPVFSQGFHTFGAEWTPQGTIWYVDGVERFRTADGARQMAERGPFYAILVLQVSRVSPYFPPVDASTPWPGHQYVDYVRIWKRPPPTPPPPTSPVPAPEPPGAVSQ